MGGVKCVQRAEKLFIVETQKDTLYTTTSENMRTHTHALTSSKDVTRNGQARHTDTQLVLVVIPLIDLISVYSAQT